MEVTLEHTGTQSAVKVQGRTILLISFDEVGLDIEVLDKDNIDIAHYEMKTESLYEAEDISGSFAQIVQSVLLEVLR